MERTSREIMQAIWNGSAELHPLNALTQQITVDGCNIVPLVEMARLCYAKTVNVDNYTVYKNNRRFYAIRIENTIFGYDAETRAFVCIPTAGTDGCKAVVRQWDMFCMLLEYRIDFLEVYK